MIDSLILTAATTTNLFLNPETQNAIIAGLFVFAAALIGYVIKNNSNGVIKKADIRVAKAEIALEFKQDLTDILYQLKTFMKKNQEEHALIQEELMINTVSTNRNSCLYEELDNAKSFSRDVITIGNDTIKELRVLAVQNNMEFNENVNLYVNMMTSNLIASTKKMLDIGIENLDRSLVLSELRLGLSVAKTSFSAYWGNEMCEKYFKIGIIDRKKLIDRIMKILEDTANSKIDRLENAVESFAYDFTAHFYSFQRENMLFGIKEKPKSKP